MVLDDSLWKFGETSGLEREPMEFDEFKFELPESILHSKQVIAVQSHIDLEEHIDGHLKEGRLYYKSNPGFYQQMTYDMEALKQQEMESAKENPKVSSQQYAHLLPLLEQGTSSTTADPAIKQRLQESIATLKAAQHDLPYAEKVEVRSSNDRWTHMQSILEFHDYMMTAKYRSEPDYPAAWRTKDMTEFNRRFFTLIERKAHETITNFDDTVRWLGQVTQAYLLLPGCELAPNSVEHAAPKHILTGYFPAETLVNAGVEVPAYYSQLKV